MDSIAWDETKIKNDSAQRKIVRHRVLGYGKKPVGDTQMAEFKKPWFRQMEHRISHEG